MNTDYNFAELTVIKNEFKDLQTTVAKFQKIETGKIETLQEKV